jgi:uncharacterized protein (TIGR02588 family)
VADNDRGNHQHDEGRGSPAGEYAAGAVGALLVVALIVFLAYQAVVRDALPEIAVEVTQVDVAPAGYAVRIEVTNEGGTTAEGVVISGRLTRDGRQVDQSSSTVPYIPPDSMRTVALVFSEDPRTGQLTVGSDGYTVP